MQLICDYLIQLIMIKDFYIVHTRPWLLIVAFVEIYLSFVIRDLRDHGGFQSIQYSVKYPSHFANFCVVDLVFN